MNWSQLVQARALHWSLLLFLAGSTWIMITAGTLTGTGCEALKQSPEASSEDTRLSQRGKVSLDRESRYRCSLWWRALMIPLASSVSEVSKKLSGHLLASSCRALKAFVGYFINVMLMWFYSLSMFTFTESMFTSCYIHNISLELKQNQWKWNKYIKWNPLKSSIYEAPSFLLRV